MEIANREVEILEQLVERNVQAAIIQLEELQLSYVGGGIGDVVGA